jgi:hypothetical protein
MGTSGVPIAADIFEFGAKVVQITRNARVRLTLCRLDDTLGKCLAACHPTPIQKSKPS